MITTGVVPLIILIIAALSVLMLEAIGYRSQKGVVVEKPHIRLLTKSALVVSFILLLLDIINTNIEKELDYFKSMAMLFAVINTFISMMDEKKLIKRRSEIYFFTLSATALSLTIIATPSLILKMVASIAWIVVLTTLALVSTSGGRKAELGLKMTFIAIFLFLLLLSSSILFSFIPLSENLENLIAETKNPVIFNGAILSLTLFALVLSGIPPFHFAHVDYADGANQGCAFLLISNSSLQASTILLTIKHIYNKSNLSINDNISYLGIGLLIGFLILWLRALDQSKIRRTIAYICVCVSPLFSMIVLFGATSLLPKNIFFIAVQLFLTLSLFTIFASFALMEPINDFFKTWEDMSGFGRISPGISLTFLIAIASIAGLPGTLGYFVKLSLIAPLKDSVLFSGAILLSIAFGAACTMRIFVFMFSKQSQAFRETGIKPSISLLLSSSILLIFGLFPFIR